MGQSGAERLRQKFHGNYFDAAFDDSLFRTISQYCQAIIPFVRPVDVPAIFAKSIQLSNYFKDCGPTHQTPHVTRGLPTMRLQVAVIRHILPPVNVIFNTASSPEPVLTVADLLGALSAIIPLESSDGEWGLEEYVVEIAPRARQDKVYECLHFQLVQDVFREDEEVTVRSLTTDELRERRQGGRIQVSGDGRHLLDGVAWGRRFRPTAYRPDVIIPPRKKRRILIEEDDLVGEGPRNLLQLEYPLSETQIGTMIHDNLNGDEDDEDEDYSDEDEEFTEDESDIESEGVPEKGNRSISGVHDEKYASKPSHRRAITMSAAFEDADSSDEDEDDVALDDDEMRLLLQEAELDGQEPNYVKELHNTIASTKRRRNGELIHRVRFNESSSPKKNSQQKDMGTIGSYRVKASASNEEETESSDEDSEYTSESQEDSDSTDSNEEDDSDTDSDSDSDENSDDETSSSGSDTSSDDSDSGINPVDTNLANGKLHTTNGIRSSSTSSSNRAQPDRPATDNPPGSGSLRTRKNNDRVRRRRRLDHLKATGELAKDANFEALAAYETSHQSQVTSNHETTGQKEYELNDALESKRRELLARINNVLSNDDDQTDSPTARDLPSPPANKAATVNPIESNLSSETPITSTPSKRSKLDVESSRRMLFSSLGLRNPKTKAAEDELRNKLNENARKSEKKSIRVQVQETPVAIESDQAWASKLLISAVECVQTGRILTPPPFPFKQNWERTSTGHSRKTVSNHDGPVDDSLNYDDTVQSNDALTSKQFGVVKDAAPKVSHTTTVLNATSPDDVPYHIDLAPLEDLKEADIVPGMVIAYKELYMNSRFEPEESEYRIASVISVASGHIVVQLSKRDRRDAMNSLRVDDNGDRVFHGFELPDESAEMDDGSRALSFENLIDPKIVKATQLVVPSRIINSQPISMATDHESPMVPESALVHGLSSIISHAEKGSEIDAFSSPDEDELLRPIEMPTPSNLNTVSHAEVDLNDLGVSGQSLVDSTTHHTAEKEPSSAKPPMDSALIHAYEARELRNSPSVKESGSAIGNSAENVQTDDPSLTSSNHDDFTSFHDDESGVVDLSMRSLKSVSTNKGNGSASIDIDGSSVTSARNTTADSLHARETGQPSNPDPVLIAQSQKVISSAEENHPVRENQDLRENDEIRIIPSTPEDTTKQDLDNDPDTNSQTRSSQRIARAKLDISSPAARMMRSALTGMGSRKSLNARRKAKV